MKTRTDFGAQTLLFVLSLFFVSNSIAQFQSGFNKEEYRELMHISAQTTDSENTQINIPNPQISN